MPFIAGAYTAAYGVALAEIAIGQIEAGFTLEHFVNKRQVTGDVEADTSQDAVFQGHEFFLEFILMEYDVPGAVDIFWPYDPTYGTQGQVGRLDIGATLPALPIAQSLVLTAVAGTTAKALAAEDVWTFPRAILAEDFPVRVSFAPDLRDIRIRMRIYPVASVFFTRA